MKIIATMPVRNEAWFVAQSTVKLEVAFGMMLSAASVLHRLA